MLCAKISLLKWKLVNQMKISLLKENYVEIINILNNKDKIINNKLIITIRINKINNN